LEECTLCSFTYDCNPGVGNGFRVFSAQISIQNPGVLSSLTSNLLLYGSLFSALTIIMGLFLSKEEGYSGSVLQWHKWSGVSLVFFSSIIYWCRDTSWYIDPVAKTGAVITFFCLIFTGHFGATLTHGDNFILEPIIAFEETAVSMEQAVVFDHVIKPIFEKK
jgi:hypothetical protein